jgi:hypothetical protein
MGLVSKKEEDEKGRVHTNLMRTCKELNDDGNDCLFLVMILAVA